MQGIQRFECKFTNNQFVRRRGERKWIGPGDGTPFPTRNPVGRNNEKRILLALRGALRQGGQLCREISSHERQRCQISLRSPLTISLDRLHEQKGVTCRDAFARARQPENLPISLCGGSGRQNDSIWQQTVSLESEDPVVARRPLGVLAFLAV